MNKKEYNYNGFTYYIDNNNIIVSIKAPAPELGLAHALMNIGKNIKELS